MLSRTSLPLEEAPATGNAKERINFELKHVALCTLRGQALAGGENVPLVLAPESKLLRYSQFWFFS